MQYISGRRINQDFGVPGITTNDTVINVDGRIAVGIGTSATASVDAASIRFRGDLIDTDGLTGEIGYFLTKDAGGLVWSAVNPTNENSVFVSQNGNQVGVSSYIGFNFKSDEGELVAISTNTGNPAIADIEILSRWNRDANTGIYTSKNIGIGSTTPNVALDIVGDGNFTGIVTANKFAGNSASVTNLNVSGVSTFVGISTFSKIGIGTTAPTAELEIIGGAKVSGILTAGSLDVTGSFSVASATTATNLANGLAGQISYQTEPGITGFLTTGLINQVLTSQGPGTEPIWTAASGIGTEGSVDTSGIITATGGFVGDLTGTASTATNLANGLNGQLLYQSSPGTTGFLTTGIAGYVLTSQGPGLEPSWQSAGISSDANIETTGIITATGGFVGDLTGTASTATNLANGLAGQISYQSSPGTTGFLTTGITGYVLKSRGAGQPPNWQPDGAGSAIEGITIKDAINNTIGTAGSITTLKFEGAVSLSNPDPNQVTIDVDIPTGIVTTGGLSTSSVGLATTAINLKNGSAGEIPYQQSSGITTFLSTPGSSNRVLLYDDGNNRPKWDKVGLGTNTTGDYVKSVASGDTQQISVTGTGEGADVQISIANNPTLSGSVTIGNNLNVGGNIFIGGTTASLDVNEFKVTDKNVIAGFTTDSGGNDVSNDITARGGGISVASTVGNPLVDLNIVGIDTLPTTYKRLHWYQENSFGGLRTDAWLSNYAIGIGSTQLPNGTRLAAGNVQITENDIIGVRNVTIGNNLNVTDATGISTLGVVKISSGIITNTNAGVAVTVFGDLIGTASTASFATTAYNLNGTVESDLNVSFASSTDNVRGGLTGQLLYQENEDNTGFLTTGPINHVLTSQGPGLAATWTAVGSASAIEGITIRDESIIVGSAGSITNVDFRGNGIVAVGTVGNNTATVTVNLPIGIVTTGGLSTASVGSATTATNLDNGSAGEIPYQQGDGDTTFLSVPGSSDQVLLYDNGNNRPKWDKVGLGTNTEGDYVKSITGTANEVEVTSGSGEGSTPTIGLPNNVTISQNLTVNQDLNIGGNIFIGGTTASLDVNDFKVKDKNAILGFTTNVSGDESSTDTTASGGGISIASTIGTPLTDLSIAGIDTLPTTYKRFHWYQDGSFAQLNTDAWLSNYAIGIGSTQLPAGTYFASGNIQLTEEDIVGVKNIKTTGISTLGVVEISSAGIVSATSGVVTYYGDGSNLSNVDADTLDNLDSTQFLRSDVADTKTSGDLTFNDNVSAKFGTSGGLGILANSSAGGIISNAIGALTISNSSGNINISGPISGGGAASYIGISSITREVTLSYDNSDRLKTKSYGIAVSGIVSAISGVVTYYGDGSQLTDITGGIDPTENTANQAQFIPFFTGTATTSIVGISTTGFVFNPSTTRMGIGTDLPESALEINVGTAVSAFDIHGSEGQLFSVTNNLTSGSIFSVNDVSGIPSIDVDADGTIQLAPFGATEFVGVGTTSPTAKLEVNGTLKTENLNVTGVSTLQSFQTTDSGVTIAGDINVTGVVTATDFNSTSDAALKTNVQVIDNPLDKVLQINGVSFNWIENNKPSMGVIAQQLEGVIPELVKGDDTTTRSVNYNGLIGLLIEVVKDQQTQINSLNDRLSKLE